MFKRVGGQIELPERVHSTDAKDDLLVVAMANQQVFLYDLSGSQPRECALESRLHAVCCSLGSGRC
jgi:hypothetical protein